MKHLVIHIDDHELIYRMDTHALAQSWIKFITQDHTCLSWSADHFKETVFSLPAVEGQYHHELAELCAQLGVASDDHNWLHLQFQQQTQCSVPWTRVNQLIHQIEDQHKNFVYAKFWVDHATALPLILPQHRSLWQHVPRAGDLCMGYHTVGKTLWHACQDNDTEVVRTLQLKPQQTINTEIMLYWRMGPGRANSQCRLALTRWLKQNLLTEYVNLDLLENRYHHQPRLAQLLSPSPAHCAELWHAQSQIQHMQFVA